MECCADRARGSVTMAGLKLEIDLPTNQCHSEIKYNYLEINLELITF